MPEPHTLVLNERGMAYLGFVPKLCEESLPGVSSKPFTTKEIFFLIPIEGPTEVEPVPGAPVTLPTGHYYMARVDFEAPDWFARHVRRKANFEVNLPEEVHA